MSETADLTIQEPGANGLAVKLTALLGQKPKAIEKALDSLSDDELSTLRTIEAASEKPRPLVIKQIDLVLGHRSADASLGTDPALVEPDPARPYAHMPAASIDRSKLKHEVLTRDGWVLPLPRAEG